MGVTGLWQLLDNCGKPVPVESLEGKILAIDISIWLHQVTKGFQDSTGAARQDAHVLGLFSRICKLLNYRIRPVFVFDGRVPVLKLDTIKRRQKNRSKLNQDANKIERLMLQSLAQENIVKQNLGEQVLSLLQKSPIKQSRRKEEEDIFKLPELPSNNANISSESNEYDETSFDDMSNDFLSTSMDSSSTDESSLRYSYKNNLEQLDIENEHFKSLPADTRYELLTEIKETHKQSSWGRIHELPSRGDDFSTFQMNRLLKKFQVQKSMKEAQEEMGGKTLNMTDIENIFIESGVIEPSEATTKSATLTSDEHTRFWLVRDLKRKSEMENLKKNVKISEEPSTPTQTETTSSQLALREEVKDIADIKQIEEIEEIVVMKQIEKDEKELVDTKKSKKLAKRITGAEQEQIDLEIAVALSLEDLEKREEEKQSEPLRLNAIQRKHLKYAAIGPARAYMIEYGNVNNEEVEHIMDNTQISMNFENSKKENQCDSTINLDSDDNDFIEVPSIETEENVLPVLQQKTDKENTEKSSDCVVVELSTDDDDSDFEEVPDVTATQGTEKMNYDDATTTINPVLLMKNELSKFQKALEEVITTTIKKTIESKEETKDDVTTSTIEILDDDSKSNCDIKDVSHQNTQSTKETKVSDITDILTEDKTDNQIKSPLSPIQQSSNNETTAELLTNANNNIKAVESEIKLNTNDVKQISEKNIENLEKSANVQISPTKVLQTTEKMNDNTVPPKTPERMDEALKNESDTNTQVTHVTETSFQLQDKDISEQLQQLHDIQEQRKEFELQRNRKERMGMTISQRMISDCQELLRLFGIPYIIAPMEAEAQCAFLDEHQITHGTITDDSDIWLFGGRTVYKNFFDNKKHVYEFKAEEIKNFYHCDRKKLVQLACLVGSDYTLGIHGIGTTLGLEILSEFSLKDECIENNRANIMKTLKSLQEFQEWAFLHQNSASISPGTLTRVSLKKKLEKIQIPEGFPSLAVIEAYLTPTVDEIEDSFKWGQPDIDGIIGFTRKKMSWTKEKTETILKPVLNRLNQKTTQKSIRNYFTAKKFVRAQELQVSKRVQNAIRNMVNSGEQNIVNEDVVTKRVRKKKTSKNVRQEQLTEEELSSHNHVNVEDEITSKIVVTAKQREIAKSNNRQRVSKSKSVEGAKNQGKTTTEIRSKKRTKNTNLKEHIDTPAMFNTEENSLMEQTETKELAQSSNKIQNSKGAIKAQTDTCVESTRNYAPLRKRTNATTVTESVEEPIQNEKPTVSKRAKGPSINSLNNLVGNSTESKAAAMFRKITTKTEIIPQREKQKTLMDKNKEKAVELFKKLKESNTVHKN